MKVFYRLVCLSVVILMLPAVVQAGTLLWEDFESDTPDALPNSPGYLLQNIGDPVTGTLVRTAQDGALFDDPIGPDGNKSAVIDNNNHIPGTPDGPTNVHMGWSHNPADQPVPVFPADPADFTHGYIEFDLYMENAPLSGTTYTDLRLGYRDGSSVFVSTGAADTIGSFPFRINKDGSGSVSYRLGGLTGSVGPVADAVNTVRVDILPDRTETMTLNGTLVEWDTAAGLPGGPITAVPWMDAGGADGMNIAVFVGDFQGEPTDRRGLVFIDNVHIVQVPEPGALALTLLGTTLLVSKRRRAA